MVVTRFEIISRSSVWNGASFDGVGQYEIIRGTLHYAVDDGPRVSRLDGYSGDMGGLGPMGPTAPSVVRSPETHVV